MAHPKSVQKSDFKRNAVNERMNQGSDPRGFPGQTQAKRPKRRAFLPRLRHGPCDTGTRARARCRGEDTCKSRWLLQRALRMASRLFSHRLRQIGITPLADTSIRLEHYKRYGFSYEDLNPRPKFDNYTLEISYPADGDRP
jgi:hypothetical protein